MRALHFGLRSAASASAAALCMLRLRLQLNAARWYAAVGRPLFALESLFVVFVSFFAFHFLFFFAAAFTTFYYVLPCHPTIYPADLLVVIVAARILGAAAAAAAGVAVGATVCSHISINFNG